MNIYIFMGKKWWVAYLYYVYDYPKNLKISEYTFTIPTLSDRHYITAHTVLYVFNVYINK